MKVNCFIIGAAKSGSTSLYHYLNQHPEVYFSPIKETNYFSKEINIDDLSANYKKNNPINLDKYFSADTLEELPLAIVQKKAHYEKLFQAASDEKIRAEASVSYMYSPVAANEIFKYNPEAKLIAILRNPIERAFSHYLMALRFGYTSLPFRDAFDADRNAKNKGWGVSELFYELGLYHQQLSRFYELFPKENIQIHLFEDFHQDKNTLFQSIFEFLALNPIEINTETVHNPSEVPKNPGFNKVIYRSGIAKVAKHIFPKSIKSGLKSQMLSKDKPKINDADRNYLLELYRDEILASQKLINRDLSEWLK
ncbi:MAG: sulfotransferase [Bacteroidota bacterium]|nr:sulfotransferase [Bacteroidota bacterium]